jgi:hypothetical protein
MMMRWILALVVLVFQAITLGAEEAQNKPVEIGYIEGFDHSPDVYVLKTGDVRREVAILAPVFNDDTIEVTEPSATLILRLVGQEGPLVLSKANDVARISGQIPQPGFWSGIFSWTASAVQILDQEQREPVSASIRGEPRKELSAPIFATPQTVLAGRRKLTIGWVSPRAVDIRIVDRDGRSVTSGRGSGNVWTAPEIGWEAGAYTIELAANCETVRQSLQFVPPDQGPPLPADLANPTAPEPLRAAAMGAWYAAANPTFLLEALQHVAAEARSSPPARLLTRAFIGGKRPLPRP